MIIKQWDKPIELDNSDLINFYLTWINDYLTISKMAYDYGMSYKDVFNTIKKGRKLNNSDLY